MRNSLSTFYFFIILVLGYLNLPLSFSAECSVKGFTPSHLSQTPDSKVGILRCEERKKAGFSFLIVEYPTTVSGTKKVQTHLLVEIFLVEKEKLERVFLLPLKEEGNELLQLLWNERSPEPRFTIQDKDNTDEGPANQYIFKTDKKRFVVDRSKK